MRLLVFATLTFAAALPVCAQNPEFQAFFFDVCAGNTTGALSTRCGETPGAAGDLSDDSESSLNPSQALAGNPAGLARVRVVSQEVQERMERGRRPGEQSKDSRTSILAHLRWEGVERDTTANARGLDGNLWGVQFGSDFRLSDRGFIGWLFSYDRGDSTFDTSAPGVNFTPPPDNGTVDLDSYSLTFYGSHGFTQNLWIDGSVGYGITKYDLARNAVFQESDRIVPQTNVTALTETDG